MSMILQSKYPLVCLVLAFISQAQSASADHIDFIRDDSTMGGMNATFSLTSSNATPVSNTQMGNNADILGGTRAVSLARNGGFGGAVTASKVAGTDFINFTASNNLPTGRLTLDYDGFENANFAALWDGFLVDIPLINTRSGVGSGSVDIRVSVFSTAGNGVFNPTFGNLADRVFQPGGTFSVDFSNAAFASVNFADVDRVTFDIQSAIIGTQFQVGSILRRDIVNVPEPSGLGLLACLSSLTLIRRKRV